MDCVNDLKNIYWNAIREVDPAGLISSSVRKTGRTLTVHSQGKIFSEDLSFYHQIIVLGAGKASARMASVLENILGEEVFSGIIVTKYGYGQPLKKIRLLEAGHPVPDEKSLEGARAFAKLLEKADRQTLVINLISGGGSSLLCMPSSGITLQDKRQTTSILLESGANIDEVNCIRKHLSGIKGGGLARMAGSARLLNLILSDVVGDRIDTIASGVTAPDPTTFQDALALISRYRLYDRMPKSVMDHLARGADGHIPETPKPEDPVFSNTVNIILGNNDVACQAAGEAARNRGYGAHILGTGVTGEASTAGMYYARLARMVDLGLDGFVRPVVMIAGGESTVTIRGKGKGGRNQEMALAFACELHKIHPDARNIFFLSAGTDGSDGPTDAAGAFVTPELMDEMKMIADEAEAHLIDNDSYSFFQNHNCLFQTGPTYTNVCDLQILLVL